MTKYLKWLIWPVAILDFIAIKWLKVDWIVGDWGAEQRFEMGLALLIAAAVVAYWIWDLIATRRRKRSTN